jgi:ankyrin repeat protein
MNINDAVGNWALRVAAENGRAGVVRELIRAGANVRAFDGWALRVAAENGHANVVRELIRAGAEPTPEAMQLLAA